FQIDGNATGGTATSHDWNQVYSDKVSHTLPANSSGTGALQFTHDQVNTGSDDTFSNSPKDTQDVSAWKCGLKQVSANKDDLADVFAAVYLDTGYAATYGTTHTLLYVGTDRFASGSNSAISMWFLQNPIGEGTGSAAGTFINKNTGLAETHVNGDLLIQASLGSSPTVTAFQWQNGTLQPITLSSTQAISAINTSTISVPWTFLDKSGSSSPLAQEFFEVGLDMNEVFKTVNANLPSFSSFIITTRTSSQQTATLSDFVLGNVSSAPDVAVAKTADAASINP